MIAPGNIYKLARTLASNSSDVIANHKSTESPILNELKSESDQIISESFMEVQDVAFSPRRLALHTKNRVGMNLEMPLTFFGDHWGLWSEVATRASITSPAAPTGAVAEAWLLSSQSGRGIVRGAILKFDLTTTNNTVPNVTILATIDGVTLISLTLSTLLSLKAISFGYLGEFIKFDPTGIRNILALTFDAKFSKSFELLATASSSTTFASTSTALISIEKRDPK